MNCSTELILSDAQKDLTIKIASPELRSPHLVRYSYQLLGHDKNWVQSGSRRYISYTNLHGGKYKFRYRARFDGEDWIGGTTELSIRKLIPFWHHPLSIIGAGVFFVGLIGFIAHLRIRSIRKEAALETAFNKRLMEIELSALRAQMNPHFLFNSRNSIKYYILKNKNAEANTYLTKFSQLMRSVLKNSKSRLVSLADELHALR